MLPRNVVKAKVFSGLWSRGGGASQAGGGAGRERAAGRASIYRILEELDELGVVSKVELGQGQARYEPVRPDHHHHHLVCDNCGAVIAFDDAPLERAVDSISKRVDFAVEGHEIVLHGRCADCR